MTVQISQTILIFWSYRSWLKLSRKCTLLRWYVLKLASKRLPQALEIHSPFSRLILCYRKTLKYFWNEILCLHMSVSQTKRYQHEPYRFTAIIQGHLTDSIVMIPMCLRAARDWNTFESFQANFDYNQLRLIMSSL